MSRKEWQKLLKEQNQNRPMSISVSAISILYGIFIIYYHGYFLEILHPSLIEIEPIYLGLPIIVFGLCKILGIAFSVPSMRQMGVTIE